VLNARIAPEFTALRRTLGWLVLAYLGFIVYGSLVPLKPAVLPLDEAWRRFIDLDPLRQGELSRIDLAVNISLTVPLALLARAWLYRPGASPAAARLADAAVWLGCAALSLGVEFAQVHFPARSHALSDVLAQWLGAALGLALHAWRGDALRSWALGWWRAQSGAPLAAWVLRGWLVALVAAALVPLDLTVSPVELYRKWRDGRVFLLPFTDLPANLRLAVWDLVLDALAWLPVGALWRLQGASIGQATWRGMLAAAAIEVAQLAVFSRVSSSTDVLIGALGVALGAALSGRWAGGAVASGAGAGSAAAGGAVAAAVTSTGTGTGACGPAAPLPPARLPVALWRWAWLGWALVLPLGYWFPYAFDLSDPALADKARAALIRLPFEALFYSGEQRAVTEILRKLLLFAPGGLLWALWHGSTGRAKGAAWPWLVISALMALTVEAGQLALPDKLADSTDALLGWVGGIAGWWLGRRLVTAPAAPTTTAGRGLPADHAPGHAPAAPGQPAAALTRARPARPAAAPPAWFTRIDAAVVAGAALACWLAVRLPGVPYNLRELLPGGPLGLLSALALVAVLWWWWVLPLALAPAWSRRPGAAVLLLPLLPLLGLPPGLALLLGAPRESLHDVVGSPVWADWPPMLELLLRYAALHGGLALASFGAVWAVARLARARPMGLLLMWAVTVLAWAAPVHLLVVTWAATDNLTELMRGGGGPLASLCLGTGLLLLLAAASALAALLAGAPRRPALLALVPLGLLGGSLLLWWGSEPLVMKYDRLFSAAQFLLSAGRDRYASAPELLARWMGVLAALLCLVCVLQLPRWRALLRPPA